MNMWSPRNRLIVSLLLAGVGLTLFFSDTFHISGLPPGFLGVWLFVPAVWFFVDAVHRIPRSEGELGIAPGEWQAWVDSAFASALLVTLALKAPAFIAAVPINENPAAGAAGRGIGSMLIAWLVLAYALKQRWHGLIESDERDRQIAQIASLWGRNATTFAVIVLAVLLGFSPTARLQVYGFSYFAHVLTMVLVLGAWFDYVVAACLYYFDRRKAQV